MANEQSDEAAAAAAAAPPPPPATSGLSTPAIIGIIFGAFLVLFCGFFAYHRIKGPINEKASQRRQEFWKANERAADLRLSTPPPGGWPKRRSRNVIDYSKQYEAIGSDKKR